MTVPSDPRITDPLPEGEDSRAAAHDPAAQDHNPQVNP